jgi:ankyrin repeat protein
MSIGPAFGIPTQQPIRRSPNVQFGMPNHPNRLHHSGSDRVTFGADAGNQIDLPQQPAAHLAQQLRTIIAQGGNAAQVQAFMNALPLHQRADILTQPNQTGHTALHLAVDGDNPQVVQTLINTVPEGQRANVINHGDNQGETALHWTILNHNPHRQQVAQVLINAVPVHQQANVINHANHHGATPLDLAQAAGNPAMIGVFLNLNQVP